MRLHAYLGMFLKNKCFYAIFFLFYLLQGCVAVNTFPTVARAGDTITLAVGSPDGMTVNNTNVTFQSDDVNDPSNVTPVALNIRSIVKIRPDPTSATAVFDSNIDVVEYDSSHSAWLSIILIDLPPDLPVGSATLKVDTSAPYPSVAPINNLPIAIDILAGTGNPASFSYRYGAGTPFASFSKLEPLPQAVIRPPTLVAGETLTFFSAVEFKLTIPTVNTNTGLPAQDDKIRVIADDYGNNTSRHTTMDWSRNGDEVTVYFINSAAEGMPYIATRFSVVLSDLARYKFIETPAPTLNSVIFYDENGVVISNMPAASDYSVMLEHL